MFLLKSDISKQTFLLKTEDCFHLFLLNSEVINYPNSLKSDSTLTLEIPFLKQQTSVPVNQSKKTACQDFAFSSIIFLFY